MLFTDLRVYSGAEALYNCELQDNTRIVATNNIPKGSVICESLPIFTFNTADTTTDLLITLNHLDENSMDSLLERTRDLYPVSDKDMIAKLKEYDSKPSDAIVAQMMQQPEHIIVTKVVYNAFHTDKRTGLYFLPAKFNHNCIPNCKWICFDDTIIFLALRDITQGEELTHCYYPQCLIEEDKDKRAQIIKSEGRGKFVCSCPLCMGKVTRSDNYHIFVTRCQLGCFTCGSPVKSKCKGCKVALYCSPVCQKHGWKNHKLVCRK